MNKTELEKAIKNGESVWINGNEHKLNKYYFVAEYNNEPTLYLMTCGYEEDYWDNYPVEKITNICKTKAEAEHYLHHANITRTEQLPFLSWEEFLESKNISFTSKSGIGFLLEKTQESIVLWMKNLVYSTYELTEQNFYKAYDECVRLFKGE